MDSYQVHKSREAHVKPPGSNVSLVHVSVVWENVLWHPVPGLGGRQVVGDLVSVALQLCYVPFGHIFIARVAGYPCGRERSISTQPP